MSSFSIGSSGGSAASKARDIPEGTAVTITHASIEKSRFTQVIQKGPNAGKEMPKYQLKIVLEADGGNYAQYLGGVYPKDNGDFNFSPDGSATAFVKSLQAAGLTVGAKLESLVGLSFTAKHHSGGTGKMAFVHIHAKPATMKASAPTLAAKATATTGPTNAFTALSEDNRTLLIDATKDGTALLPQELVEAGVAKDTTHATAILDGLAAYRAQATPKLARK